jgi:hypothetical protein
MNMKYLLLGAGAAILGMLPLPIDAYHLIRWAVSGTCAFGSYESFQRKAEDKSIGVVLSVVALVYNPITPFYLSRGLWLIIDLLAGGFLIWAAFSGPSSSSQKTEFLPQKLIANLDEKLAQVEKKSDGFMKQTLISAILLLLFVTVISFAMKK